MLNTSRNSSGPRILPDDANEIPNPAAIIRSVPQKNESPIPANGPISDAFTALIELASKSSSSIRRSSMADVIPSGSVDK
ncbi:hypothetical protein D3C73_1312450 [compost metagenome]